ncbi:secA [Symbiodinium sp. CCMP2456]|nr:secA [Symbiodinium sp. CCMP2456]
MEPEEKRAAYACDVTYVTNQQLGFDYLRDQMACRPSDLRLRSEEPFSCAIVDEADSVLIDEGRTPLVVSTQSTIPSEKYTTALQVASQLAKLTDYTVLEKEKTCVLTEVGELKVSAALGKDDLFDPQDPWAPFIVNSLTAKELYQRDRQYLVRDGKVVVVDEFTGRPVEGRSWSDGLQQAWRAVLGVSISGSGPQPGLVSRVQSWERWLKHLP